MNWSPAVPTLIEPLWLEQGEPDLLPVWPIALPQSAIYCRATLHNYCTFKKQYHLCTIESRNANSYINDLPSNSSSFFYKRIGKLVCQKCPYQEREKKPTGRPFHQQRLIVDFSSLYSGPRWALRLFFVRNQKSSLY
jgi:hypothetical protein